MSYTNLKIQETSISEFRDYLILKNNNIHWFYWHLNSNLKNFTTYKLFQKNNLVGVFCVEKNKSPMADLYIDEKYRRLGYGKFVVKYITTEQFQQLDTYLEKTNTFLPPSASTFEEMKIGFIFW